MSADPKTPTAVLLIAHGSRRQQANDDLVKLAEKVAARNVYEIVEISYLELAEPTIPQGARRSVQRGAGRVLMFPYFLSAGAHVVSDLEEYRRRLADEYPAIAFHLCPPLGLHPLLVDVVFERIEQGIERERSTKEKE